ncbi:MAG: VCBS repeat-containing protein [Pseudomonadota bacterium]
MPRLALLTLWSLGCVDYGVRHEMPLEWLAACPDGAEAGWETFMDADCQNDLQTGSFSPVVEWYHPTFTVEPEKSDVMSTPVVVQLTDNDGDGDIDADDTPDIAFVSYTSLRSWDTGVIRVLAGDDGHEELDITGYALEGQCSLAAGDLDGDGVAELVAVSYAGEAMAFRHDGALLWTSLPLTGHLNGAGDAPAIADLDGDGAPEIIVGRAILNADGSLRGAGVYGMAGVGALNQGTAPVVADIDADGVQEVVVGNAVYGPDGLMEWTNGQADGFPAVADFDADREAEIVVCGAGTIRLQETDGTVLWSQVIPGAEESKYGGPPTIADYDGDSAPEIGVASGSRYTVFEADGSILWQRVTDDDSSGNTGSSVFDFEGDGVAEVVYADETTLWVYSGVDGSTKLESFEHSNATLLEYPVIADVDGDDQAEIVVVNAPINGPYSGVVVLGDADRSWRPGRKIWNQHAYAITNVEDDGHIPAQPELNWLGYNNFRSGDMTAGDGMAAPNLALEEGQLCTLDCEQDLVQVCVHAANVGAVDLRLPYLVEGVAVEDGEETRVDSVQIEGGLAAGTVADAVCLWLDAMPLKTADELVVRIRSGELECDAADNELRYPGPFCLY